MFKDLEDGGLTVPNAVALFNRTVVAARALYRELHTHSRFAALDLKPYTGSSHRMLRDGGSKVLSEHKDYFETNVLLCAYRCDDWSEDAGVSVAIWLPKAEIRCGAFRTGGSDLVYDFVLSEDVAGDDITWSLDVLEAAVGVWS